MNKTFPIFSAIKQLSCYFLHTTSRIYKTLAIALLTFALSASQEVQAITKTFQYSLKIPDIKSMRIVTPGVTDGKIVLRLYTNEAGESVKSNPESINNKSWLQLTSISPNDTRKVMVQITSGSVPPGTILTVTAAPCLTGAGTFGTGSTVTFLGSAAYPLITNIGSCYTGSSEVVNSTSGYNLTYSWAPDPANLGALMAFTSYQLLITYTFSN